MSENAPDSVFKFSKEFELLQSAVEKTYPVPVSDWNRWIARLRRSEDRSSYFHSIAWGLFGVATTAFFSAIALPETIDNLPTYIRVICWGVFAATSISGTLSLAFFKQHKKDRKDYRVAVIEDMEALAKKYQEAPTEPGSG